MSVTVNIHLGTISGIFQKYSRMLIIQQFGCASGTDCSRNLNLSMESQNKTEPFAFK